MTKEEILEKSRNSGVDEMEKSVEDKAYMYGSSVVVILAAIFLIYKTFKRIPSEDMSAIIFANIAVAAGYQFVKLHKKIFLVTAICGGFTAVVYTVGFLMGM